MPTVKNAITWFEIPVSDFHRAKVFYTSIFDCTMSESRRGDILMGFFPFDFMQGGIGGALVKGAGYDPGANGSIVYLNAGDDLQVVLDRVEAAGGKIISAKAFISQEIGHTATVLDSEGNRIALHSRN